MESVIHLRKVLRAACCVLRSSFGVLRSATQYAERGTRYAERRTPNVCLVLLVVGFIAPPGLLLAGSDAGVTAITVPSADVTLSFVQPGRIANVRVREGEAVTIGQVLIEQDDGVDRIRLAQLEASSQDTTQIQAAEASLAQKKVDLKKIETAAAKNAATELEVEYARLNVTVAGLSLQLAVFEHEQAKRKYEEVKLQIENMSLKSPIGGSVEKIDVETGESVDALASAVRVVQTDPLWIDVPVPLTQARSLQYGAVSRVEFPDPQKITVEGMVIYMGAVADAASGTLRVRIQVPNKSKRPAGEHVKVIFPAS